MWTAESLMAVLAAQLPAGQTATLLPAAGQLADFLNQAPVAGSDVPEAAKAALRPLIEISDVGGAVKIGDVVIGPQLKVVSSSDVVRPLDLTPRHGVETRLQARLRTYDPQTLEAAVRGRLVALANEPLDAGPYAWKVARALLQAERAALVEVAKALAPADCKGADEVVHVAWPFSWVDPEAAARVAEIPPRPVEERGIALNATRLDTGHDYIKCAPLGLDRYAHVGVSAATGEETTEALTARIIDTITAPVLDRVKRRSLILFVVLEWAVDRDQLQALRAAIPLATFVVLVGAMAMSEFEALRLDGVEYLRPPLDPGEETAIFAALLDAKDDIDTICRNLG